MKRIDRYIFTTVASTGLVALLALVVMEVFIAFLGELEDLGKGGYGILEMLNYLLLTLPGRIYEIFPMGLLLGGLLGMGALASHSELVVMRATGLSVLRLTWSALQAGLAMGVLALLLGEFIVPTTERTAEHFHATATGKAILINKGRGFWARDGDDFIHVRAVLPGVRLEDVRIYSVDDRFALTAVTTAKAARYLGEGGWQLENLQRNTFRVDRVVSEQLPSAHARWALNPEVLEVLATDPRDLSMRDLVTFIGYLRNNALDARTYELAFWVKALAPLTQLTVLFVAMPFAFAPQRATGAGQRLMIGVFLGLIFYLLHRMLGNTALLYDYPPLLGALSPNLVLLGVGSFALQRMR